MLTGDNLANEIGKAVNNVVFITKIRQLSIFFLLSFHTGSVVHHTCGLRPLSASVGVYESARASDVPSWNRSESR
jgi:hypothetical protein